MTTKRPTIATIPHVDTLSLWINRGIEALWLSAIVLVPLAFLDRQYAISEAVIAYVEVPKIALVRTIAGFTAILWLVEWGISRRTAASPSAQNQPAGNGMAAGVLGWFKEQPGRWLMLSVWLYLGTVLLGTIFSASVSVSLWGEVPGQDGYSAYTVVAYVVLFSAVATHLKTRTQLTRLLGAIALMGTLVAGYGVLQHNNHDFLNLTEATGGGVALRVTAAMGNAIFAAAVMSMTIPMTVIGAAISLKYRARISEQPLSISKIRTAEWGWHLGITVFWVLVLTIQLLGLIYTFSRGPWLGTLAALIGICGMTAVFAGWAALARVTLLLGVAGAVALAVAQWDVSISDPLLWVSGFLILVAALVLVAGLGWRMLGRVSMAIGVALTVIGAVVLFPSWFSGGLDSVAGQSTVPAVASDFDDSRVSGRLSTIGSYVSTGFFSGRGDTWYRSWEVIRDRPWFEFDDLSLPWIRPVLGYGPDLFRYTYLLKSVPQGGSSPVEPDHAHNYFITQAVELGALGLVSSLGVFATVFLIGGYLLFRRRKAIPPLLLLLTIGIVATMGGRFVEMMVGLARVSDLTVLWIILGVLAALPGIWANTDQAAKHESPAPAPAPRRTRRMRSAAATGPPGSTLSLDWPRFLGLAVIAVLVGGIFVLIWVKNVNYVRASVQVGEAVEQYRGGDFQASLSSLDRAIGLAPDVSPYYNYRAQIYFAYHAIGHTPLEAECSQQTQISYAGCLNVKSFESNLKGVESRPFYYRSRWALANSALNLKQDEIAIRIYEEVSSMVPNGTSMQNEIGRTYVALSEAYIAADQPELALVTLDKAFLQFDNDSEPATITAKARFFQGIALQDLARLSEAAESFELSLAAPFSEDSLGQTHKELANIYAELDENLLAGEHRELANERADQLFESGEFSWSRNRFQLAAQEMARGLDLEFDREARNKFHKALAMIYPELGEAQLAEDHRNLAQGIAGDVFLSGIDLRDTNQLSQAVETINRSLKLFVSEEMQVQGHRTLAEIYDRLNDTALAEEHRGLAQQIADRLLESERESTQLNEAVEVIQRSLDLLIYEESKILAHQTLAGIYTELGQPGLAEEQLSLVQRISESVFLSGLDIRDRNQLTEAEKRIKKSLTVSVSEESRIRFNNALAQIYDELGKAETAQHHRNQIAILAQGLFDLRLDYRNRDQFFDAVSRIKGIQELPISGESQIQANYALAEIYDELGKAEEAEVHRSQIRTLAQSVVNVKPGGRDRDQLVEAVAAIKLVQEISIPEALQLQAQEALAKIYTELGEPGTARQYALTLAKARFFLGAALRDQGRLPQAAESFKLSLAIPFSENSFGRAHKELADIYSQLGEQTLAEEHRDLAEQRAEELFESGGFSWTRNRFQLAAEELEQGLVLASDDDLRNKFHKLLSQVHTDIGQEDTASEHLARAQEIADDVFQTGLDFRDSGKPAEATETIEHSLTLLVTIESLDAARQILGDLYEGLGEPELAQKHRTQALRSAQNLLVTGLDLIPTTRLMEAEEIIIQSLGLTITKASEIQAHQGLAMIFERTGRPELADEQLNLAQEVGAREWATGLALRDSGRLDEALEMISQSLDLLILEESRIQAQLDIVDIHAGLGEFQLAQTHRTLLREFVQGIFDRWNADQDRDQITETISIIKRVQNTQISAESQVQANRALAELYDGLGDIETAQHHRDQMGLVADRIFDSKIDGLTSDQLKELRLSIKRLQFLPIPEESLLRSHQALLKNYLAVEDIGGIRHHEAIIREFADAEFNRGLDYRSREQLPEAAASIERALELMAGQEPSTQWREILAEIYRELGRTDSASGHPSLVLQ